MPITEQELRNHFGRMPDRIAFKSAGAVPLNKWNDNALNDALRSARLAEDHGRYARLKAEARRRGWAGYVSTKQFGA
jgi:hypothetical protein